MKKPSKPNLAAMIASRRAQSAYYITRWGVNITHQVSQVEIDYWLLFIVDQYSASLSRRNFYVADFNVVGKIKHAKESGTWPLPVTRNQHFLPMFRLAYNFPL